MQIWGRLFKFGAFIALIASAACLYAYKTKHRSPATATTPVTAQEEIPQIRLENAIATASPGAVVTAEEGLPNFVQGNFRIQTKGSSAIAVRGKVVRILAKEADLQLFIGPDLEPKVRTLTGEVALQTSEREGQILIAKPGEVIELSQPQKHESIVKDFWVWLGVGVNYTSNRQSVQNFSDLEYGQIKEGSALVKAGFFASENLGLELAYKTTPGEAKSGANLTTRNGSYVWKTLSVEALYRSAKKPLQKSDWIWRAGLHRHQIPFLVPESAEAIRMTENALTNLSLGFEYRHLVQDHLRFEWLMRYQQPLSSSADGGASFSLTPKFSFDGSIGSSYRIAENTFLGIYWYGHYQEFAFKYQDFAMAEFSGTQSLFFTNFDLRLGWEF